MKLTTRCLILWTILLESLLPAGLLIVEELNWQDCVFLMGFYLLGHLPIHIPWIVIQNKRAPLWYTLTPLVGTIFLIHLLLADFFYELQNDCSCCGMEFLFYFVVPFYTVTCFLFLWVIVRLIRLFQSLKVCPFAEQSVVLKWQMVKESFWFLCLLGNVGIATYFVLGTDVGMPFSNINFGRILSCLVCGFTVVVTLFENSIFGWSWSRIFSNIRFIGLVVWTNLMWEMIVGSAC